MERKDFVSFRERLERLVASLLALRQLPSDESWGDEPEHVGVKLESHGVAVEFAVEGLSWETACRVAHLFQSTFSRLVPLLSESNSPRSVSFTKTSEVDGSYGRFVRAGRTSLDFSPAVLSSKCIVAIHTVLSEFDDHFETCVTETARLLFPPVERPKRMQATDAKAWQKEFGRAFAELGCRILASSGVTWKEVVGLPRVREELERAVLLPLVREGLYRKVARAVMPAAVNLLPHGVLLSGPPGTGKTWSMRALATEVGVPVVALPCDALMTKWYGESERRLAKVFRLCREAGRMILFIDELDALARHRESSHETTARLVSILLSEMDGLAGGADVLIVGSANAVGSIDAAVLDRFDVRIPFDLPDAVARRQVLACYAKHLAPDDVTRLAERMDGWSCRQVARFGEAVVRAYVSTLDLTQLEAPEPPLPRMEDYEREMEVRRPAV